MSSSGYYVLVAVFAIGFAVSTFLAQRQRRIEDQQKGAEQRKRENTRHSELTAALTDIRQSITTRTAPLREGLWERYPFGFVLYGSQGGNFAALPFPSTNLEVTANWEAAKFTPNYPNKTIAVELDTPKWKQKVAGSEEPRIHIEVGKTRSEFPLVAKKPMPFRHVVVGGQPRMYFEIIDADQRQPIYAIGFKKPDTP